LLFSCCLVALSRKAGNNSEANNARSANNGEAE